jgi:hypothetical protein
LFSLTLEKLYSGLPLLAVIENQVNKATFNPLTPALSQREREFDVALSLNRSICCWLSNIDKIKVRKLEDRVSV